MSSHGEPLYAAAQSRGGRLIFVGDIHGCFDEMTELLERLAPRETDVVVSCGDIVRKGPEVERCLDFWRERGYLAVRGNNEMKVLRYGPIRGLIAFRRGDLREFIRTWPLMIDFPAERISAVHGGVLPHTRVSEAAVRDQRDIVYRLRYVRERNGEWHMVPKGEQQPADVLWSQVWDGDRTIVYGHTPLQEPRFDANAIGLDTGCVYGGMLTAAVFERGEWKAVSVNAKRKYSR